MYTHILIPTDGSELARKGVDHGLTLAKKLGSRVTLLTVTEAFPIQAAPSGLGWVPSGPDMERWKTSQKSHADAVLAEVRKAAETMGVEASAVHVPDGRAADAIVETAKSAGCNLIVMGSHGRRGLTRLLLGSQTSEVLAHSPVPVLVVR